MTVKELSVFCGKSDKTIRRWVNKAGQNVQGILDKMSKGAAEGKAVDFSIDEVEEILKASSMSKDAVSILMENARNNQDRQILDISNRLSAKSEYITRAEFEDILGGFANTLTKSITAAIVQSIPVIQSSVVQSLPSPVNVNQDVVEYYTILGYNNIKKLGLDNAEIRSYSFKAKRLSKEMGKEIKTVPDSKWGQMNTYHISVLEELFDL